MSLFKFLIGHIFLSHVLGDFCITIWIIQNVFQKKAQLNIRWNIFTEKEPT